MKKLLALYFAASAVAMLVSVALASMGVTPVAERALLMFSVSAWASAVWLLTGKISMLVPLVVPAFLCYWPVADQNWILGMFKDGIALAVAGCYIYALYRFFWREGGQTLG